MNKRPRTRETRQRRIVYETIRNAPTHPTADWIFEQVRSSMPKISLGTVYRNLSVLKGEGLVREVYGNDRRAHYETTTSPHAHFICSTCGRIWDVEAMPEIDWRPLKELVGCQVATQRTEFVGSCASCLRKTAARN